MIDKASPNIVWFRQDLRLADNPALYAAHASGEPILPIYILDDENAGDWKIGGASRVFLHHALYTLNKDLGGTLQLFKGKAQDIIQTLVTDTNAKGVYWNRCYEPWRIKRDKEIKSWLDDNNITGQSHNGSLLWEPWKITKDDGTPYKVFTPYYKRGCLSAEEPREPLPKPTNMIFSDYKSNLSLADLDLLPTRDWGDEIIQNWDISESGANKRLNDFLDSGLSNYKEGRNHPADGYTSRLAAYLRHGLISPNTAWYAAKQRGTIEGWEKDRDHFLSELGWREFSYSLLYYFPTITWENLNQKFNKFPWSDKNSEDLRRWQRGQTGYPIVDAGMRELYQTGYMHNRVRMIVGSFLVKNLLIHWHKGEEWFWDCLFDADLASNSASWQWIAGCGADAAPYFRIFNPLLQSKKFDGDGAYIRKYVPELAKLDSTHIHAPWEAPPMILAEAGVKLGETYPEPIVDHPAARDRALEAFQSTKQEDAA